MKQHFIQIFTILALCLISQTNTSSNVKIKIKNKWFIDEHGRVKLFHGINAVSKSEPWIPNYGHIDLTNNTQLDNLKAWGFNVIRLGIMWTGLRPSIDYVNMTYLNEMIKIINNLASRDIYVIIDLHQDMLSTKFESYDGAPRWLIDMMPSSRREYPWPFTHNNLGFAAYLTEPCSFAFEVLYKVNEFRDYFVEYWTIVSKALYGFSNVLGYELINEPWAGDIFENPLLLLPAFTGSVNLLPFYNYVYREIRKYDNDTIVFFEPVTWGIILNGVLVGTGFNSTPGGDPTRTALSWHYYCWLLQFSPNPLRNGTYPFFDRSICDDLQRELAFNAVKNDKNTIGCPSFLTEFGVCAFDMGNGTLVTDECEAILNATDAFFESWTYWDSNFYDSNNQVNFQLINIFSRVYPMSTSGLPVNLYFDTNSKIFIYEYKLDSTIKQPTEVFIPEHVYPNGFQVSVSNHLRWSFDPLTRILNVDLENNWTQDFQAKVMIMPILDFKKNIL